MQRHALMDWLRERVLPAGDRTPGFVARRQARNDQIASAAGKVTPALTDTAPTPNRTAFADRSGPRGAVDKCRAGLPSSLARLAFGVTAAPVD